MSKQDQTEDPRRDFLVRALAMGLFATSASLDMVSPANAGFFGKVPRKMPAGKSIYDLKGTVMVDGKKATNKTIVRAGSVIESAAGSRAVFVVGKDAFLMKDRGRLELGGDGIVVKALRLLSGRLLSVFGETAHQMTTPTVTIGIRGTGLYVESNPGETYACTCYGIVDFTSTSDPNAQETIVSTHHDAPRYIASQPNNGKIIRPAPFKNHTDEELTLIEALVGRTPPFSVSSDGYSAPRRIDY